MEINKWLLLKHLRLEFYLNVILVTILDGTNSNDYPTETTILDGTFSNDYPAETTASSFGTYKFAGFWKKRDGNGFLF